jgi:Mg2+ and Co2+ transporter CorA
MESVCRSFVSRPLPFEVKAKDIDSRESHKDSLVHYLQHIDTLKNQGHRHPLFIIQGLARIIASEWIVVNTYIERDLNNIEWTLETENVTIEVFERFIKRLFILRRRIRKYKTLVDDQLVLFQYQMPAFWGIACAGNSEEQVFTGMKDDLVQVQKVIDRNTDRISQTLELITSIMSARVETSIMQNRTLGFVAILATVALPFNTIATIVGLQTDYAPGKGSFMTYLIASSAAVGVIATVYAIFRLYVWSRGHRVGLN